MTWSYVWLGQNEVSLCKVMANETKDTSCRERMSGFPNMYSQSAAEEIQLIRTIFPTYLVASPASLKGQSNEIFYLPFFHWLTPLKPLTRFLKTSNSLRYSRFFINSPL
jgi:hypothetical protein